MAGGHARSAITGTYISRAAAARHPRTSVVESGRNRGAAMHNRSAITGRYVTGATARHHPNTTVTERS